MPDTASASPFHSRRVAVTAAGIVSPLGKNLAQTLDALKAGRDCVSPVTQFDVTKTRCSTAGQIPGEFLAGAALENRKTKRLHRASHMMIAAMREAYAQAPDFSPELAVLGTTSGGMSFGESFFRSFAEGSRSFDNAGTNPAREAGRLADRACPESVEGMSALRPRRATWLANYSPQKPVLDALDSVGVSAPCQIIANACASGTNAIGHAFSLVRSGKKSRVLCGGYDAISEMVFVGFDSLQAATPEKIRPFDKARTGLVLGEGAAILALESWDDAVRRGARILAEITGYGISTDNYHLTQPHPSGIGPLQAMSRALQSAGRAPGDVDYINAHGTATIFNDATEGAAMAQLFGGNVPVSSTKSMMGHALGAAGAIEAAICILALQHQFLPPNIHFREKADPSWGFDIVANEARDAKLHCVISNSFGFGGTNATIVLEGVR